MEVLKIDEIIKGITKNEDAAQDVGNYGFHENYPSEHREIAVTRHYRNNVISPGSV